MLEIINLDSNFKSFTILFKCPTTHIEYRYDVVFNKYYHNDDGMFLENINVYDVIANKNYNKKQLLDLFVPFNLSIFSKIFIFEKKYILYNIKPLKESSNYICNVKYKSKLTTQNKMLLDKCFYKESNVKDFYLYPINSNYTTLHNHSNLTLLCDYKITDFIQIILELCSNTIPYVKNKTSVFNTNIIICNKFQIYTWEKLNKHNKIKFITTVKNLNSIDDIGNYKIVILLNIHVDKFISISKQKKYIYSRFIFQSIYNLTLYNTFENMVYSIYIFINKSQLILYFTKYYSELKQTHFVDFVFVKINVLNNMILKNELHKLSNDTINSYIQYINDIVISNDTLNEPLIQYKDNYHIVKHNYGNTAIKDGVIDLVDNNKIQDVIYTNNIFDIKIYNSTYLIEKKKDNCCICLDTVNKPVFTSCCKQLLCLKCSLLSLKIKLSCPLCRTLFTQYNTLNIVQNDIIYKKNTIPTIKYITDNSHLFNKIHIFDKIIEYILVNSEWNRKIIIVTDFGTRLDYLFQKEFNTCGKILKKHNLYIYNIYKSNLNTTKYDLKQFDTIGGVLIIPNVNIFKQLNITIDANYIIHYHNTHKNNLYNSNRYIYDNVLDKKDIDNPIECLKNIITNKNVTIFDLVI